MKKLCALSLIVLLSFPGCVCRKKKEKEKNTKKMMKRIDVFSSVNIPLVEDTEGSIEDKSILSVFDEGIEEFTTVDENFSIAVAGDEQDEDAATTSLDNFSWIEAANEDDEFKAVYFSFNHYGIQDDQKETIDQNIMHVKEELEIAQRTDSQSTVVVEGHACHSAGSSVYNLALSERRAKYVSDMIVAAGVSRDQIKVVGRGQEMPVVVDSKTVTGSREDQWLNRRVEMRVIYS